MVMCWAGWLGVVSILSLQSTHRVQCGLVCGGTIGDKHPAVRRLLLYYHFTATDCQGGSKLTVLLHLPKMRL